MTHTERVCWRLSVLLATKQLLPTRRKLPCLTCQFLPLCNWHQYITKNTCPLSARRNPIALPTGNTHSMRSQHTQPPSCMCRLSCLLWIHWAAAETGALFVVFSLSYLGPWYSRQAPAATVDIRQTAPSSHQYSQHTAQACTTVAPAALSPHTLVPHSKSHLPLAGQHQLCGGSCSILATACWAGGLLHCTQCQSLLRKPCFEPTQTTNQCRQAVPAAFQCVQLSSASWRW